MKRAAALLVLLSACTRTPAAGCGKDGDCGASATCLAHACVAADPVPYEVKFLVVPPSGSTLAPAFHVDPCLRASSAAGCARQLTLCDYPRLTSDARPAGARLVGRGTLDPNLDLVQDVDVTSKPNSLSIPLLPGSWKMIYFPPTDSKSSALAPTSVHFPVGDCERGVALLDELGAVAMTDTYGQSARSLEVHAVVDQAHDPRPFCGAVLDAVDSPASGRVISNVISLPNMTANPGDAPVCTSATNGGTLYIDEGVATPWLRIRPRKIGDYLAPVQFVQIPAQLSPPLIVDSHAAMPRLEIQVLDADKVSVDGARVRLGGKVDPLSSDPSSPRFATSEASAIAPGLYRTTVPPGCYSVRVEPPPGTMQSVAVSADMDDRASDTTCTTPGQIRVRPGGVARAKVTLAQRNKLTVTVESTTKDPVFGAIVTAVPRGAGRMVSASSGADGVALLNLDADQDYDIDVAPTSGDLARRFVNVKDPKTPVLTVDLPHAIRVVGQLVQGQGGGVAGASVQAFASPVHAGARPLGEAVTDEDGRFRILLPPSL